jgi:probable rRNA maturation factor
MIFNRQGRTQIRLAELQKFLARARRALRLPSGSFAVSLVTNAQIARWNRCYRGKNNPTDVLSFPVESARKPRRVGNSRPGGNGLGDGNYLGDIAIAPAIARRNARRFGRSFEQEMHILALHGMLHLMGYDHETDRGQMERREQKMRRVLGLA